MPSKPATKQKILSKKPRTANVMVLLDDDLALALEEAQNELDAARSNGHSPEDVERLEQLVKEARRVVDDKTIAMRFESIGSKRYDELVDAHPPTKAQIDETEEQLPGQKPAYNRDTFEPALVCASLVDPKLPIEEVVQLRDEWNEGEWLALCVAAFDVNTMARGRV